MFRIVKADDRFDALDATLDYPRQAAGPSLQMESKGQAMHVDECLVGELVHRMLADPRKQRITQLIQT